jgi:endonuclease/exonuclease/phosphatase family metal-dependent hydrolase
MRNKASLTITLFALMLLLVSSKGASAQGNKLMVMTWNVAGNVKGVHCTPRDLSPVRSKLQTLQSYFRASGAPLDVVGFQEIYLTQAYDMARALGFSTQNLYFIQTKTNCGGFGNAIVSRLPMLGTSGPEFPSRNVLYLHPTDLGYYNEQNVLGGMSIVLPGGQKVRIYNTHLLGDNSIVDRYINSATHAWRQWIDVTNAIQFNRLSYPSILMGDFNIHPSPPAYWPAYTQLNYNAMLFLGFRDLWAQWAATHGNPYGNTAPALGKRIDYIVTRDSRINVINAAVPDTGTASDHRPMVAYLSF